MTKSGDTKFEQYIVEDIEPPKFTLCEENQQIKESQLPFTFSQSEDPNLNPMEAHNFGIMPVGDSNHISINKNKLRKNRGSLFASQHRFLSHSQRNLRQIQKERDRQSSHRHSKKEYFYQDGDNEEGYNYSSESQKKESQNSSNMGSRGGGGLPNCSHNNNTHIQRHSQPQQESPLKHYNTNKMLESNKNLSEKGLSILTISRIPIIEFDENIKLSSCDMDKLECIICLVSFEKGDKLKLLFCTHRYHVDCIDSWLKKSSICPSCKFNYRSINYSVAMQ